MAIPEGIDCQVRPRSGLATKFDIVLANGPGTVDPDYRGEIACALRNNGDAPYTVQKGDRIAQLIFVPVILPQFHFEESIEKLPSTIRNSGGFGSTGINSEEGFGTTKSDLLQIEEDIYMMKIVLATAERSNCIQGCVPNIKGIVERNAKGLFDGQKRKIGCVIAKDGHIVASGFNHQSKGEELCAEVGCLRQKFKIESGTRLEVCRANHAETSAINAAAKRGISVNGATLYCNAEPCLLCARIIAESGIARIVVLKEGYSSDMGSKIVINAGIPVGLVSREQLE